MKELSGEYKFKVSVVTAVYNVEPYLKEMVESVISQTLGFGNIQLILVDDGATDKSGAICDFYSQKYPNNIITIHKENGGLSDARNAGLTHAQGKYVSFCDSDDKLKEDALEKMYDFIESNYDSIDLVSVKAIFFERKSGEHCLNYKYSKTRIVDLEEDYDYIQLFANSTLIKTECFQNRKFDVGLSYAEDLRLINEILLDKMSYGVVSDTCYYYRKRKNENSLLDYGRYRKDYYTTYLKRALLSLMKLSKQTKGYIPKFVQYLCLEDLYWKINDYPCVPEGVLSEEEKSEFISLSKTLLNNIDDEVIVKERSISRIEKYALMKMKDDVSSLITIQTGLNTMKSMYGDYKLADLGEYTVVLELLDVSEEYVLFEGCFKGVFPRADIKFYCGSDADNTRFYADLCDRTDKNTYLLDEPVIRGYGFKIRIPNDKNVLKLRFYTEYQGHSAEFGSLYFGKFFPIANEFSRSYYADKLRIITWQGNSIIITPVLNRRQHIIRELKLHQEVLSYKEKGVKRGIIERDICHIARHFKRRKIWIISDRLGSADDNGKAFFKYLMENVKRKDLYICFLLNKSSVDYHDLKKIGKVVDYNSVLYKFLALLCDISISSHAEEYELRRLGKCRYLFKDITYGHQTVFLQHGLTLNDVSRWLRRSNKNITMFITSTTDEYNSILEYDYGYTHQVKLTGMPRYDYLSDEADGNKIITVMPSWRKYLVSEYDLTNDSRSISEGFEKSTYCSMYRQLFSNEELVDKLSQNGYTLQLKLHPTMPEECVSFFDCDKRIKVLDNKTSYRDIYAVSNLVITDYSSASIDFSYLYKPVVYYQADRDEFFSGKHTTNKGYFDFERDGFGEVVYSIDELCKLILGYVSNDCKIKDKYRKRIDNTFVYHDRNNSKRVYEEICKVECEKGL